jgi:ArsR family transcriptional regulator
MRSVGRKAELLRVISHPVRIKILEELTKGVKCVSDFEEFLEISQPNMSQHFALLRNHSIIDYYMDGRLRCYFLVDPIIPDIIDLLKKDYHEALPAPECCPITKKGKYPGRKKNKTSGNIAKRTGID